MNKRTFIHKPSELLRIGKEIVKQSDDQRYIRKVTLVNMMLERKMKAEEISELSGVTRRTLSGWVKIADEEGFDALRGKARTGRSSKLSKEQKEEIKNALINPPKESGYYKWDGISLSDYIKSQYDIDLSVRQCQRLFHELGFSKIRPQIHPSSGELNEEERKAYKKTADLANNPNAILVFQDEVHYKVQTSISSMWAIKGSKPKVKSYPGKDNISYSGFVIPSTGELFTCKPQWFNYETTISSIRDL